MTDVELLEKHRGGCEEAFADLVRRHIGWIYGVARRGLRDSHLAEDVTQAVFVLLHRKAPRFTADRAMVSWLHKATRYATQTAAKSERRRQRRETEAAMRTPQTTESPQSEWTQLAPELDEMIGRLSRADREAILLRYYRDLSYAEIAVEIGTTEEAARKRVDRAIEKLRQRATEKGLNITAGSLAAGLANQLRIPPPPGLIATTTGAATAHAGSALAASSASIVKGAMFIMTYTKIQFAAFAIFSALVLIVGTAWVVGSSNSAPTSAPSAGVAAAPAPATAPVDNPPYPRLAPYSGIRWRGDIPEVQIDGTWYELVALDDQSAATMVQFAQKFYRDRWQKRFSEDLVELLTLMGHPPGETVTLQLRTLDKSDPLTMKNVPMTEKNRQMIWRQRNEPQANQPGL
jgi:RNA polymerase sigma factor (sigma-70 family)